MGENTMNIYNVIHLIQNMDNVDKLDKIFSRYCFNTSVITEEVKEDIKKSAIEIAKIGERKVYEYIMDGYVGIN
jgi:hypothetical protein